MHEMLTVEEVLEKLKVGRTTLYRWIDEGKIKPHKLGNNTRRLYFKREEIDNLFQPVEDNDSDLIVEPTDEELQEVELAFQEADIEIAAGTLSTSEDIKRMAAEILAIRRANTERASA